MEKEMVMENFFIVMEVFMKDIGKIIKKKDMAFLLFKIEANIVEILKKIL